jgi:hypothetical protein
MPNIYQGITVTIKMGPFVSATNKVSPLTNLAGSMVVYLSKKQGALEPRHSTDPITHDRDGYYDVPLDNTDKAVLGSLRAEVNDSALHLPVWELYEVLPNPSDIPDEVDNCPVDIRAAANNPIRTRGDEGEVQERSIDELIAADRYAAAQDVTGPPYGMRVGKFRYPGSP